ncbi:Uncharacterised protein [Streptococcus pneumoniae]|nr:hypothetical protein EGI94_07715 [Stutzerimonas stutzeri]RRV39444.1 hypothetical protein EGJ12_04405 [Stutzerimonas stutzeri]RRW14293.1 hypothetical protein EGJ71_08750 [Stutzerimonas stutzeri]CJK79028.1 Uncharacterised protein [Streptococcus pneumoniae]HAJ88492.1 hypothetical protein [Pseudomonas sp.]
MRRIERQYAGGAVDERVPDRCVELIRRLPGDPALIQHDLGVLLGRYRGWREFHDTAPQIGTTIDHLKAVAKQAEQLREAIGLIPPDAEANLALCMHKAWDMSFFELERSLEQSLVRLQVAANHVADDFKQYKNRKGEKPNTLEHGLLSDVASLLESQSGGALGKIEIAGLAAELIINAGVFGVPGTPKRARDAIIAWRKRSTT